MSSSSASNVRDKEGKFVGGAAVRRRRKGNKIQNPLVRQQLASGIAKHIHPQERLTCAILRTLPRDILKSHNFPFYRKELQKSMCERVRLGASLAPLKSIYKDMAEHNQIHAAMVLEEARHVVAESLFQRWGRNRIPPLGGGIELDFCSRESMKNSDHLVYFFKAKNKSLTLAQQNALKAGTVVELMPAGLHSIEHVVLGNTVRHVSKEAMLEDEEERHQKIAVMVYNKSGEKFSNGVHLVILESLLSLTRQFDAVTNGNNSLNGELLGKRHKKPVHIKFSTEGDDADGAVNENGVKVKEEEDDDDDHDDDIKTDSTKGHLKTDTATNEEEEVMLQNSVYDAPVLNASQLEAANSFLNSHHHHHRISLVQGPPGTGKSQLVVSVICRYLLRAQGKKRLLVSAPTNKAVTVLATRVLHATRNDTHTSVVLIGDQDRLLENNRELLRRYFVYTWRDAMMDDWNVMSRDIQNNQYVDETRTSAWAKARLNDLKRQVSGLLDDEFKSLISAITQCLEKLEKSEENTWYTRTALVTCIQNMVKLLKAWDERDVVQTLLREAHVMFCTLTSAGSQIMKDTCAVDDAIVDEAAAATGPELCIGLWLVNNRLLLVGDPSQLPATVASKYGKQHGLDRSLQDRLMNQCDYKYTMLDVQYRMKKEISLFPNNTFYGGKLTDAKSVRVFSYQPGASVMQSQPYAFVQVGGKVQRSSFGSSFNNEECMVVVGLVQELKANSRHLSDWSSPSRIRIITFYQAQVQAIRQRLRQYGLHNVLVSTVDSSQGCEADIIFISFVRDEEVGFLDDFRRLNVALTRAKHQLVCIGNVKSLASLTSDRAAFISSLAKDALERKCMVHQSTLGIGGRVNPPNAKARDGNKQFHNGVGSYKQRGNTGRQKGRKDKSINRAVMNDHKKLSLAAASDKQQQASKKKRSRNSRRHEQKAKKKAKADNGQGIKAAASQS